MSSQIDGQTDLFEALGGKPPQPPFTVYLVGENGWPHKCGWCGGRGMLGGGIRRLPTDPAVTIAYQYCEKCHYLNGQPLIRSTGGTPIVIGAAA